MDQLTVFIVSFSGGIAVFVVIVLFHDRKRRSINRHHLVPLAQAMGGDVPRSLWWGHYCRLDIQGFEGRIIIVPNSNAPMMILILFAPLEDWLIVKWSNAATRTVSKRLAISSFDTGDPVFDGKYVINAGDKMRAQALLMDRHKRAAMDWLLSVGYWRFAGNKRKVTVTIVGFTDAHMKPEFIRESFRQMLSLARVDN